MKFSDYTLFIMQDGTVKVCGDNRHGQLGLGHRNTPVSTVTDLPLTGVKDIVCGSNHTFFIMQDGTIKCCGYNRYGQLGLGFTTPDPYAYPTVTDLPFTGVKNIVCGSYHTFFIMQDGTVKCCGRNQHGQLGLGHKNDPVSTVRNLPLTGVKNIVCGSSYTFFIMQDGSVKCCGRNDFGQLGLGFTTPSPYAYPTVTDLPFTGVKNIVCGESHTFFIMEDGTIKCCGRNDYGQLGLGYSGDDVVNVTDLQLANVKKVVCGEYHTIFVMEDGTLKGCGHNSSGQLGLGHTDNVSVITDLFSAEVKDVACGFNHTFFIMNDDTVKGCGDNRYGQLGIGNTDNQPSPVTVPDISNFDRFPHSGDVEEPTPPVARNVTIIGEPQIGQILIGSYEYYDEDGDLEGESVFRWLIADTVDGEYTPIDGATNITYTVTANDINKYFKFEVTPISIGGDDMSKIGSPVLSAAIGPVVYPATIPEAKNVAITGTLAVGETLTGSYEYFDINGDPEQGTIIKWYRGDSSTGPWSEITSANGNTYTLTETDVGKYIKFEVTPANANETGEPAFAVSASQVEYPPTPPVASNVVITGIPEVGKTLTGNYDYFDINGDPEGESTFRWLRSDTENGEYTAIPGATSKTYVVTEQDVGKWIKFEVTPVSQ